MTCCNVCKGLSDQYIYVIRLDIIKRVITDHVSFYHSIQPGINNMRELSFQISSKLEDVLSGGEWRCNGNQIFILHKFRFSIDENIICKMSFLCGWWSLDSRIYFPDWLAGLRKLKNNTFRFLWKLEKLYKFSLFVFKMRRSWFYILLVYSYKLGWFISKSNRIED